MVPDINILKNHKASFKVFLESFHCLIAHELAYNVRLVDESQIVSNARKLKTSVSILFYFSAWQAGPSTSMSRSRFNEICTIGSVVKAHEEKCGYASGPNKIKVTETNIYVTSQRSRSQFKRGAYGWLQEEEAAPQLASR